MDDPSDANAGAETKTAEDDGEPGLPELPWNLSWTVVIVAIVAFVLGLAAGGLAEHFHVKGEKHHTAASSPTTAANATNPTGAKAVVDTAVWFGNSATAACPDLKVWHTAILDRRTATSKTTIWKTKRAAVVRIDGSTTAAYRRLAVIATAKGKPELQYLLAQQTQLDTALQKAATPAAYNTARKALTTARVNTDISVLSKMAATCA